MSIFYLDRGNFPFIELWNSDFLQLGFYCREETENGHAIHGYNFQTEEDGINIIMLNLFWLKGEKEICEKLVLNYGEEDFERHFLDWFLNAWLHEWFHLIGFEEMEIGVLNEWLKTGKNVYEFDMEDNEVEEDL